VTARRVWLHGDFGPSNIVLAEDGVTVGLDASLASVGRPEEDLARFVALVSGAIRLAPELGLRPLGVVRSELEDRLLGSYYGPGVRPALFELTYLHQLCRRWRRLRELSERHEHGPRMRMKLSVIDRQIPLLMKRSEARLVRSLQE
jgi:aminoglycoside phosphotransferase (APT) family kinase protein